MPPAPSACGEIEGQSLYQRAHRRDAGRGTSSSPTRIQNLSVPSPADLDMAGAEIEVARMDEPHDAAPRGRCSPLKASNTFDYMFLDCPPSLGILMSNALAAADEILVPVQCEYYALEGLGKLMGVTDQIRACGANPELWRSAASLMTMYDNRTNLNPAVVKEVRDHFQEVAFQTLIPRTVRFGEAPSHGRTILEHEPQRLRSAIAYRELAEEFLERQKKGLRPL